MSTSRLGVCSWSLRPDSPADLVAKVRETGLDAIQLALDPIRSGAWSYDETVATLRDSGITILSGMMGMAGEDYTSLDSIKRTGGVRPDATWPANLAATNGNAELAKRLEIPLVTFHAGFIPHDTRDSEHTKMIERLRKIAGAFDRHGVRVAFETGQETADTLLAALDELERPEVGVNFDPANMILYGMGDPVEALRRLAPRVAQIHIKDANPSKLPQTWGSEVVVGTGAVDWPAFFEVVRDERIDCDLVIEREAGDSRVADIIAARKLVESLRSSD
ncbi:MAG: sugar phosphate isomerase/epimerase family protein [Phycisphaerales bacterium]